MSCLKGDDERVMMKRGLKLKLPRFDKSRLAMTGMLAFMLLCALVFAGCSKAVVTKTQIVRQKVPDNLLILRTLNKPVIKDENDILRAYSDLFLHYKECVINVQKIKELNAVQ